ncbi:MAG: SpoIVB peptidase S55 domain-containing protein [Dorea formicigenerans]
MDMIQCEDGTKKLGIWVRDNAQGLGTITYLDSDSHFGALGHGIHDIDTGELLNISDGTLYLTSVKEIQKGVNGTPGGMEGIIVYNNYNVLGKIKKNTEAGILELLTGLMSCSQIRLRYNWQKRRGRRRVCYHSLCCGWRNKRI